MSGPNPLCYFFLPPQSHAGKVVLRNWYERNKHIFPASRWEPYDPEKTWDTYTVRPRNKLHQSPCVLTALCASPHRYRTRLRSDVHANFEPHPPPAPPPLHLITILLTTAVLFSTHIQLLITTDNCCTIITAVKQTLSLSPCLAGG